tara:strand:- start:18382 stop:18498 length:117 start_codon:yes stop_codon:yes gene_type:complete
MLLSLAGPTTLDFNDSFENSLMGGGEKLTMCTSPEVMG